MHYEIANLLSDNAITLDDLDGFTEDIKGYARRCIGRQERWSDMRIHSRCTACKPHRKCILQRAIAFCPQVPPGGGVQNLEYSASWSPQARKTALKALDSEPQRLKSRSFFHRMCPMVPAFRPKSSMQASPAAENSQNASPLLHPGTRSKKTNSPGLPSYRRRPRAYLPNLSAGGRTPPCEAHGGVLIMSEDDLR